MKRFEIDQSVARIIDEDGKVIVSSSADSFAFTFLHGTSTDFGILPPAVRWMSHDGTGIIVERPPHRREILYRENIYDIAMPWTVWGIHMDLAKGYCDRLLCFARPSPISHGAESLFFLPLPLVSAAINHDATTRNMRLKYPIGTKMLSFIDDCLNRDLTDDLHKGALPGEWRQHFDREDFSKYFAFLQGLSLEELTFTDFVLAHKNVATVDDLVSVLEEDLLTKTAGTTLEFLEEIILRSVTNGD